MALDFLTSCLLLIFCPLILVIHSVMFPCGLILPDAVSPRTGASEAHSHSFGPRFALIRERRGGKLRWSGFRQGGPSGSSACLNSPDFSCYTANLLASHTGSRSWLGAIRMQVIPELHCRPTGLALVLSWVRPVRCGKIDILRPLDSAGEEWPFFYFVMLYMWLRRIMYHLKTHRSLFLFFSISFKILLSPAYQA